MERLLLRPGEAALLLGVGKAKMYALLAGGTVPRIRLGKSIRVPVEGLRRWIDERAGNRQGTT